MTIDEEEGTITLPEDHFKVLLNDSILVSILLKNGIEHWDNIGKCLSEYRKQLRDIHG
jgi:hypothetical protein